MPQLKQDRDLHTDSVYYFIDLMIELEQFDGISSMLHGCKCDDIPRYILLALLAATAVTKHKNKLPSRSDFYIRAKESIINRGEKVGLYFEGLE